MRVEVRACDANEDEQDKDRRCPDELLELVEPSDCVSFELPERN